MHHSPNSQSLFSRINLGHVVHIELIKIAFFFLLKYFSFSSLETMIYVIYFTHHNAEIMILLTGRKSVRFAVFVTW